MSLSPRAFRILVSCYFAWTGLATSLFVLLYGRLSRSWVIADWLINYQGGFVRRGLPGQIALLLSRLLHLTPVVFPILFCLFFYFAFLFASWKLAVGVSSSWWILALLTSPATFDYQVVDLGGGGRKEIIYLAGLAVLLLLLRRNKLSPAMTSFYLSVVLVVGVLSHESIFFYSPYFFAALLLAGRSWKQASLECALPFALAALAVAACVTHPGDLATETRICAALGQPVSYAMDVNEICGGLGAMAYLRVSPNMARNITAFVVTKYHYARLYPLLAALTLIPLVGCSRELRKSGSRGAIASLWCLASLSFAASLSLFVFAIDWGRWIYIHAVSMTLLLLFVRASQDPRTAQATMDPSPGPSLAFKPLTAILLLLNATCWTLPHAILSQETGTGFGYVDLLRDLGGRIGRHYQRMHHEGGAGTSKLLMLAPEDSKGKKDELVCASQQVGSPALRRYLVRSDPS